jgi:hypothetical protein
MLDWFVGSLRNLLNSAFAIIRNIRYGFDSIRAWSNNPQTLTHTHTHKTRQYCKYLFNIYVYIVRVCNRNLLKYWNIQLRRKDHCVSQFGFWWNSLCHWQFIFPGNGGNRRDNMSVYPIIYCLII